MQYLLALGFTLMGTVMTALTGGKNLYWLIVSDINVCIALFIAWLFDRNRS